jgi:hypothetical protein
MNKNCAVGVPIATGVGKKYPPLPRTLGCQKWNLFSKSVLVYRGWRLGSPIKGRVKKKNGTITKKKATKGLQDS